MSLFHYPFLLRRYPRLVSEVSLPDFGLSDELYPDPILSSRVLSMFFLLEWSIYLYVEYTLHSSMCVSKRLSWTRFDETTKHCPRLCMGHSGVLFSEFSGKFYIKVWPTSMIFDDFFLLFFLSFSFYRKVISVRMCGIN